MRTIGKRNGKTKQFGWLQDLCNQSFFAFNHFRKPCNHPNLYRSGDSRTSRQKTLPKSHWHVDRSGVATHSSRVDAKRGDASYNPTYRDEFAPVGKIS